jgi:hypothetical protein
MNTGFGICTSTQRLHNERKRVGMECLGKRLDLKILTQNDKDLQKKGLDHSYSQPNIVR